MMHKEATEVDNSSIHGVLRAGDELTVKVDIFVDDTRVDAVAAAEVAQANPEAVVTAISQISAENVAPEVAKPRMEFATEIEPVNVVVESLEYGAEVATAEEGSAEGLAAREEEPSAPAAEALPARGWMEVASPEIVRGWAQSASCGPLRAVVEILIDGALVESVTADQNRLDLKEAGIGDGAHGFLWAIPAGRIRPGLHVIQVRTDNVLLETVPPYDKPIVFPEPEEEDAAVSARTTGSAASNEILGQIDAVGGAGLIGWAYDPARPDTRLEVEILLDDVVVGTAVADQPREDFTEDYAGDGSHGVVWAFDSAQLDGTPRLLRVRVKGTDVWLPLPEEFEASVTLISPNANRAGRTESSGVRGRVERISASDLVGWAQDEFAPDERVGVEVLIDGVVWDTLIAQRPREDLVAAGIGDGAHGFVWRFPPGRLDGQPHRVEVRAKGADIPFAQNLVNIIAADTRISSAVETVVADAVGGWVVDHRALDKATDIAVYVGATQIGRGRSERYRPDIFKMHGGHGFYGFRIRLMRPIDQSDFDALRVVTFDEQIPLRLLPGARNKLPKPKAEAKQLGVVKGYFDRADRNMIAGWAVDPAKVDEPVSLDIYLNGALVRSTFADIKRSDLEEIYPASGGFLGFSYNLPFGLSLSGSANVGVTIGKTGKPIANSPKIGKIGSPGKRLDAASLRSHKLRNRRRRIVVVPPTNASSRKVAAIVLNRNGADFLETLFASIFEHNTHENLEILIVDHGSTDESLNVVRRWRHKLPIKLLDRKVNYSFSASNNFAVARTDAEVLFFLNNDITFDNDLIPAALGFLAGDVGMVGVKLASPPSQVRFSTGETRSSLVDVGYAVDQIQHLGVRITTACDDRPFLPFEEPINRDNDSLAATPIETPAVTAAALFVGREDFLAIGGFHESYFYGFEDVDLCLTFGALVGKKIVCLNHLKAYHHRSASLERSSPAEKAAKSRNRNIMLERLGRFVQNRLKAERIANEPFLRDSVVRVAFAVSEATESTSAGDYFTALELALELTGRHNFECVFLEKSEWYDLKDFDVLIAMVDGYKPSQISSARSDIVTVAWVRNWFDRWLTFDEMAYFDAIWVSSQKAQVAFESRYTNRVSILRIGTSTERFGTGVEKEDFKSDYCFTGSYFGSWRQLIGCLDPEALPYEFALFGHGWAGVSWLERYLRGPQSYMSMPDVYASTKIVLDDANHTTINWGGVNSRVFDAIAAGALVVTNSRAGSNDSFDGLLPVYTSKESLKDILAKYLGDEEARLALVARLQEILRERHTYAHRADDAYRSIRGLFEARRICLQMPATGTAQVAPFRNVFEAALRSRGALVHENKGVGALTRIWRHGAEIDLRFTALEECGQPIDTIQAHRINVLMVNCDTDRLRPADLALFDILIVPDPTVAAECQRSNAAVIPLSPTPVGVAGLSNIERRLKLQRLYENAGSSVLDRFFEACDEALLRKAQVAPACGPSLAEPAAQADAAQGLKIAYVLWDYPALSQTFVLNEIRWLVQRGDDVKVYFKANPDKAATLDFEVEAFRVDDANDLIEMLRLHKRNLIHTHFAYPAATHLMYPAALATGIPFTFTPAGVDIFHYSNIERNRLGEIASSPLCLAVFTLGTFHHRFFLEHGVPESKIVIERQALSDFSAMALVGAPRRAHERPHIISFSRFVEKKGYRYFVEAAATLPECDFTLYGYGPEEESLRRQVEELGLTNFAFGGPLDGLTQIAAVCADADLFVLPCVRAANGDMDGLPTALLEAMVAGLPVVATQLVNIPDLISDGTTGFLARPGNIASLVGKIREALALSPERRDSLIAAAQRKASAFASTERTMSTLVRVWRQKSVDIVLVTYDRDVYRNWTETDQILSRVFKYTTPPFNVIVVDNGSEESFVSLLEANYGGLPNFQLIRANRNLFCGPATNLAIRHGSSDYIIYLCSKEGYVLRRGWERDLVHYMDKHPKVGIGGHVISMPKYYNGATYRDYPSFGDFRNQEFATQNKNRPFSHVQGGVFILRREAFDVAGGFSEAVRQNGTDVEYCYFLESEGWEIGDIPNVYSATTITLPGLEAMVDERVLVVHPLSSRTIGRFERIVSAENKFCNLCLWEGTRFISDDASGDPICPVCHSTNFSRTVHRLLALCDVLQKRPRVLAILREDSLGSSLQRLARELRITPARDFDPEKTDISTDAFDLVVVDHLSWTQQVSAAFVPKAEAFVQAGGALVLGKGDVDAKCADTEPLHMLRATGLDMKPVAYTSAVVGFDWNTIGTFNIDIHD